MTTNNQREPTHRGSEDVAMETFTVSLPRWPVLLRLLGRDPLVRTIDRIEALIVVVAVVVSLLAISLAAAVGTAVYVSARGTADDATPTARAVVEATAGALAIWLCVAAVAAALYAITRAICDRIRFTEWQHDLDGLVSNGDGHQHPGRPSER